MYYNARYYVPGIGRFASADTIVPDTADPQAYNRYSYVRNNPVSLVDPSGHCWGSASGVRDNDIGASICQSIDDTIDAVQDWWSSDSICMSITGCSILPSTPTQLTDSLPLQTLWVSPEYAEQLKEITAITDGALRLVSLIDFFDSLISGTSDDIYTADNIDSIEDYLQSPLLDSGYDPEFSPYNIAMIERQRAIMQGEIEPTIYDINFMQHELIESSLRQPGVDMSYEEAHALAMEIQDIGGEWELYPTDIIQTYSPYLVGPAWEQPLSERTD